MSFALTTRQVRHQVKTVTRRQGWAFLQPGDLVQPIEQGMGLKKGEHQVLIGAPIRIIDIQEEPIEAITPFDLFLEGFPEMTTDEFIRMYCTANRCHRTDTCRRIEFEYTKRISALQWIRYAHPKYLKAIADREGLQITRKERELQGSFYDGSQVTITITKRHGDD